jgi:hypothetical protein
LATELKQAENLSKMVSYTYILCFAKMKSGETVFQKKDISIVGYTLYYIATEFLINLI